MVWWLLIWYLVCWWLSKLSYSLVSLSLSWRIHYQSHGQLNACWYPGSTGYLDISGRYVDNCQSCLIPLCYYSQHGGHMVIPNGWYHVCWWLPKLSYSLLPLSLSLRIHYQPTWPIPCLLMPLEHNLSGHQWPIVQVVLFLSISTSEMENT